MPSTIEPQTQATTGRTRILCVDDEPAVLDGLGLHLRRRYELFTATSGAAALELLEREPDISVIVSDMRMPGMDGAAFLARARQLRPDAVRILLTGQSDMGSAIAAVNEGRIFRFLTKPCPQTTLQSALEGAAEQYRLVTAERVLLEQTLHGSIKALTDVLSLTNPASFGRASRIKQCVSSLAHRLNLQELWQVEVAAMLSQIGCIILPEDTADKVRFGQPLTEREQGIVARVPAVTDQLLGSIPRLEVVRAILAAQGKSFSDLAATTSRPEKELIIRGAQLLGVASDYDAMVSRGATDVEVVDGLRKRGHYEPAILDALIAHCESRSSSEVREVGLDALRPGMVLADDVKLRTGALVITRGFEVTAGFIERITNYPPGAVQLPLRVTVRS